MFASVFNLDKPIGPCLIRALYCVALVVIALGLLREVVGGVRMMSGPPAPAMAMAGPPSSPAMGAPANPPPPLVGGERRGPGFGPPPRRYRGPPFTRPGFMMGGPMLRGWPPAALGALRIVLALLRALVVGMVIRVLAEIGLAVLAMGAKARS